MMVFEEKICYEPLIISTILSDFQGWVSRVIVQRKKSNSFSVSHTCKSDGQYCGKKVRKMKFWLNEVLNVLKLMIF